MREEREKIKKMVQDNKISSEEAESLLSALDQSYGDDISVKGKEESNNHSAEDSLHLDFSSLGSTVSTLVNNFMSARSIGDQGRKYLLERELAAGYDPEVMHIEMDTKNICINITGHKEENIICRAELRVETEEQNEAEEYFSDALKFDNSDGLLSFWGQENIKSGTLNLFIPETRKYNLFLNSKNGSLNIKQITVLNSQLTTKNGSIFFRGRTEKIKAATKNGRIKCILDNDQSGKIDLQSKNGSIKINIPDEISSILDLQTGLGRIDVGLANPEYSKKFTGKTEKHFIVENRVGDGQKQLDCKLETVKGSISVA